MNMNKASSTGALKYVMISLQGSTGDNQISKFLLGSFEEALNMSVVKSDVTLRGEKRESWSDDVRKPMQYTPL